jgi:hypothetical protein
MFEIIGIKVLGIQRERQSDCIIQVAESPNLDNKTCPGNGGLVFWRACFQCDGGFSGT